MKINVSIKKPTERNLTAIIACGGTSSRMNGVNKLLLKVGGIPVFIKSAKLFDEIPQTAEIILTVNEEFIPEYKKILGEYSFKCPVKIVSGGQTRQQSVFNAFKEALPHTKFIAVHDGARPFTDKTAIKNCLKAASVFGASVLGVPVKDTIKIVDSGIITDTPDRRRLTAVQTPQIFRRDIYVRGMNFALQNELDFTDDSALAEAVGVKVYITESDYGNFKITSADDLYRIDK